MLVRANVGVLWFRVHVRGLPVHVRNAGAGANARHSLGTAVFGGMIVATFLSLILVPVLYQFLGFLGVDPSVSMHISVGTSLGIIVPTSLRSV